MDTLAGGEEERKAEEREWSMSRGLVGDLEGMIMLGEEGEEVVIVMGEGEGDVDGGPALSFTLLGGTLLLEWGEEVVK